MPVVLLARVDPFDGSKSTDTTSGAQSLCALLSGFQEQVEHEDEGHRYCQYRGYETDDHGCPSMVRSSCRVKVVAEASHEIDSRGRANG